MGPGPGENGLELSRAELVDQRVEHSNGDLDEVADGGVAISVERPSDPNRHRLFLVVDQVQHVVILLLRVRLGELLREVLLGRRPSAHRHQYRAQVDRRSNLAPRGAGGDFRDTWRMG